MKLQKAGFVVNKVEKEQGQTGEFERLIEKLGKSKKITPAKKEELINKRIQKLIETGDEKDQTNKIKLGDGTLVTLAELRGQYKAKYNIPDEFELNMMESSDDPAMRQQALRLKLEAAKKPSFAEFLKDAKKNGLEGIRPGSVKPTLPPLPEGFQLD